jgi:DNA gyrase/topoisomerase IV subunit A
VADSDAQDHQTPEEQPPPTGEPAQAQVLFNNERIEDLPIEQELRESYLTYAMSTIIDRALPDVRDGLKPSQRRVMVAMNDLNLGPRSKHRKCAKIAGDTSGNYHPHGEGVVYPTMVRLGQNWNMRYTLVDPQGNFGSIDGDPPAAMRYTEARMTAPAMEMLEDLNLDTVDMQPNYDDTRTEPTVLPSKFPNLLCNGSQGIAVGVATSIPPHNLNEICDALVHLVDHPEATVEDLMKIVKGPDFPTGGLICGRGRQCCRTSRWCALKAIAQELVKSVRRSVTIDWTIKETVRAKLRVMVKRVLRKYGYPPDLQEKATQTVLEQAEVLCADVAA